MMNVFERDGSIYTIHRMAIWNQPAVSYELLAKDGL